MTSPTSPPRKLPLRGRIFRGVALVPEAPLDDWFAMLDGALKRSPTLFDGKAVILDISAIASELSALDRLLADLKSRSIRVLGIEGTGSLCQSDALPPFLVGGRPAGPVIEVPAEEDKPSLSSLTIEGSVRSGRSIVHPEGDVTVMGSVSSGAEILAGGSIHVYGALRGRAIAGAAKNPRARIYCSKFEPELLGIDRLVRTAEDMGTQLRGQAAQIWLEGGAIRIAALG